MVELLAVFITIMFSYGIYSLMSESNTEDDPVGNIDSRFIKKMISFFLMFIFSIFTIVIVSHNIL
jgi:magnesium-transporting ATPase (P-type)